MRIAVVSDVHGCLVPLRAALRDAAARGYDRLVCLGDAVDLGPEPGACVDLLREHDAVWVRGNHDTLDEPTPLPLLADVQAWTRSRLTTDQLAFLAAQPHRVPLAGAEDRVLLVHGSPRSIDENMLPATPDDDLRAMLGDAAPALVLCGHTHIAMDRRLDGTRVVNVGSTGQPFLRPNGDSAPSILPWAEWALVDIGPDRIDVQGFRSDYDGAAMRRSLRSSDMPHAAVWEGLYLWERQHQRLRALPE